MKKTLQDVLNDIQDKLIGKELHGISGTASAFRISEIDNEKKYIVLDVQGKRKTWSFERMERVWKEMYYRPAANVEIVFGGSGSSRNQVETIFANLGYVEWLYVNERKNIAYVGEDTHEYGTLKHMDEDREQEYQRMMTELFEADVVVNDVEIEADEFFYVFSFVGIIVIEGIVIKCCPKYLVKTENPKKELTQILKVLEKYSAKEQIVQMLNENNEERSSNLLAVWLFLMYDYYESGVYNNTQEIIESNGSGEILWDRTINETFTLLSGNRPFYTELQTRKRVNDEYDYFKRLHEYILTKTSEELNAADLLELFELTEINLSDEELDDFGEVDYILNRLKNELSRQFNTRKQLLLKVMYAFIQQNGSLYNTDCVSLFGTNNFNLVWEKICADIMDNQLLERLGTLKLPVPLKQEYNRNDRLIDLIEKPLWSVTGKTAKDTLIPDMVSIFKNNTGYDFIIFDAKYYNARLEINVTPKGQPGIESVTKQYLYQLAYQKFINEHDFARVRNCFLMPTEEDKIIKKGEVSMKMLEAMGLENIKVRLIPAKMAYEYYLSGRKMNIEMLEL